MSMAGLEHPDDAFRSARTHGGHVTGSRGYGGRSPRRDERGHGGGSARDHERSHRRPASARRIRSQASVSPAPPAGVGAFPPPPPAARRDLQMDSP